MITRSHGAERTFQTAFNPVQPDPVYETVECNTDYGERCLVFAKAAMEAQNATTKQSKVRKGTHSCRECRRRKVKCIFLSPSDIQCAMCRRRGSKCTSQLDTFDADSTSSPNPDGDNAQRVLAETTVQNDSPGYHVLSDPVVPAFTLRGHGEVSS